MDDSSINVKIRTKKARISAANAKIEAIERTLNALTNDKIELIEIVKKESDELSQIIREH